MSFGSTLFASLRIAPAVPSTTLCFYRTALKQQFRLNIVAQPRYNPSFRIPTTRNYSVSKQSRAMDKDVYHMGPGTLRISRKSFHGTIRHNLVTKLQEALSPENRGVVFVKGGQPIHDKVTSDSELLFRQEAYFKYLFGVDLEDSYGAIDVNTGMATLFIPRLPDFYAVWFGHIPTVEEYRERFAVDEVKYTDEMHAWIKASAPCCLHIISGTNTDSDIDIPLPSFTGIEDFTLEKATLFDIINECRVHKTKEEVELLRYVNKVGSAAHVAMMQSVKPGQMEYKAEAVFCYQVYANGGCRMMGYAPIAGSGANGAILHYGHTNAANDRQTEDGDLMLADMGCEYYGYTSDITTSFPINGKFTPHQAAVYNTVLEAQKRVKAAMKPGVSWLDMHRLAYQTLLEGLSSAGILKGDVQEMLEADIGYLFMPHGLGHFLGLAVHDVGGYPPNGPKRSIKPGFKSLRTARLLEPGMVITVEPGCYFNFTALLEPAMKDPVKSRFLVPEKLEPYRNFGGIRIEDNVLVTSDGIETLTNVPRTTKEIEAIMAGADWSIP